MTVGYINFNRTTTQGMKLKNALNKIQHGRDELTYLFSEMTQMKDGDGSLASHFDYLVGQFGFDDNVGAKACYDELNSALNGNLNASGVKAALDQLLAKLS